jgi:type IV secretion system protein TrbC
LANGRSRDVQGPSNLIHWSFWIPTLSENFFKISLDCFDDLGIIADIKDIRGAVSVIGTLRERLRGKFIQGVHAMFSERQLLRFRSGILAVALLAVPKSVLASTTGGTGTALPWEGPINQVLASFTGPVAKALCILAIVVLGFGFAFSDGGGLRRILGLLLGVSIAVTATSFGVTFFGFDGGAGW